MLEVAGEEGRGLSEVAGEGFELEGGRREWGEVVGSWERVGESSGLVESVGRRIRCSDDDCSIDELRVRDGDAVSWARDGCGPISTRSLDGGGGVPYDGFSLLHISIMA